MVWAMGRSPIRPRSPSCSISARALAMLAPWPATRPPLTFLQLLLRPAYAAFSGHLLLGVLNPANELVPSQGSDVLPRIERREIGDQRFSQISWKFVHDPARDSLAAHEPTVADPLNISTSPFVGSIGRVGPPSRDHCCNIHKIAVAKRLSPLTD